MIKKFIYLLIFAIISIFAFSCKDTKTGNTGNLTIIHMNDTHGRDEEEIIITNKGIEIARIISPKQAKKRSLNNLVGILPSLTDKEIENIKNERISKQWRY